MRLGARIIVLGFCFAVMVTQFQNCSSTEENSMFQSSLSSADGATGDPSKTSFSVKNIQSDLFVDGFDDHIQLGGICNVGAKALNYFEYQLIPNGQGPAVLNTSATNDTERRRLADARCENGRFYLVLPVLCPSEGGPVINGATSAQVKVKLHSFDSKDAAGNFVNYQSSDQSLFIDLAPQQGCP